MYGFTVTVNVDIFALYIFSRYSRLSNIRENMYIVKITYIMPHRGKNIKIANANPREIVDFRKCAKIYTCENIYVHSISNPYCIRPIYRDRLSTVMRLGYFL